MKPKEVRDLESLTKVNKHLGIALAELSKNHSYIGSLREQRRLIRVKLKVESIIEKTTKAEEHSVLRQAIWDTAEVVAPPQRSWVGLTDEEVDHAAEQSDDYASFIAGALFAQDRLEEKNGE